MRVRRLRKTETGFVYEVSMGALERLALEGMGNHGKIRGDAIRRKWAIPDGLVCGAIEMILDEAVADGLL